MENSTRFAYLSIREDGKWH